MTAALAGLRVIEIAGEIAGPYCTKLLVDLGAEVTKIEPPSGDPLRGWGPFPGGVPDPNRSGLFEYLNAGKHGTTLDLTEDPFVARQLIAHAHVLVDALPPGSLDRCGLDIEALNVLSPGLVVVRISDFGQHGPWLDRVATPLTMQAASGWIHKRDPDRPPVQAGARISEYVAGGYAALGALTALRTRSGATNEPVEVDVSVLESLLSTLPYPMLMAERMRKLGLPTNTRAALLLGIVRAADGWIGINCLTGQHWLDVCTMLDLPEYGEHQIAIMMCGPERAEFFAKAKPWLAQRRVAEILELSQAFRIPASPINDGATVLQCPQYAEREFFVGGGGTDWSFRRPGAPFRLSRTPVLPPRAAPRLGAQHVETRTGVDDWQTTGADAEPSLPFAGLKVLDLTTFWAGAYLTCYLGAFGAEVVKVESIQRPDGHRYSGAWSYEGEHWYERSAMWQGTNLNKRDITLDLTSERGRELARRLVLDADVVIENFSPRVVEHFGLDYESLKDLNRDVILVRMPGFGLRGPWRDFVGWALNFEQTSGMSAVTGYADGPPCNLQGPADPIVGVHAGVALLAALEYRRRTGEGQLIEVAQIEVAACVAAEPVIEYSMNANVQLREGNRCRGRLQGVYPTAAEDEWVALCVRDETDWTGLLTAMRRSETRCANHDEFDAFVVDWTRTRTAVEIIEGLGAHGVPAEQVMTPDRMYELPQLDARRYYDEVEHPITGKHHYPGWPFTMTPGPSRPHRFAPPMLGQHNVEVLRELGLTDDEIDDLRVHRIIGETALNT
ncbi:putative acyl-CoA transferase/carnitine dehydratase [Mycobacterium sp. JS623]|uniref:CaiB/BaiF CoA transferase family protein n=1 Tax=Mycobacterium sp. JS623 TaxID=212767 RepID=UPI0002A56903|nr:CoA transferase [Mycobacterium sp. JS623]AGB22434.1 putative acyl-CoA transferase/carnitine dehydratase [Mycobacterium sp. JS623]